MKKIMLIALVAIMGLSTLSAQTKLAYVSSNELVLLCPQADSARTALMKANKQAEQVLKSMYQEYQSKLQQFQANNAKWAPAILDMKKQEIQDIMSRMEQYKNQQSQELQQKQQSLFAPIIDKVNKIITKLAKEGGYTMVFDKGQLVYVNKSLATDLTPAARKALKIPAGRTLASLQAQQEKEIAKLNMQNTSGVLK